LYVNSYIALPASSFQGYAFIKTATLFLNLAKNCLKQSLGRTMELDLQNDCQERSVLAVLPEVTPLLNLQEVSHLSRILEFIKLIQKYFFPNSLIVIKTRNKTGILKH